MLNKFRTERILPGMYAVSKAGHDKDHLYIIIDSDETYVYIADGLNKTISNPKKKKYKHIQVICRISENIKVKMEQNLPLNDKDIADAVEQYLLRN